jgi:hypothetical protein
MRGDVSAYAALGLEPGADSDAVDRAYRKLIKVHHPDRHGGDVSRAAEINRAYRELRGRSALSDPLILHEEEPEGTGRGWVRTALGLIVGLTLLFLATGPVSAWMRKLLPPADDEVVARPIVGSSSADSMDQPLHQSAIDDAVRQALRIGSRNEGALLGESQACRRELRSRPSIAQLDRCAAFDDAVVQLQNRDPLWDAGPFSQPAVSRRQWSAASALSNDYLAVDGRLERVRVQVELALAGASRAGD